MFYVVSAALVVVGIGVLGVLGHWLRRLLRTCAGEASMVSASTRDQFGLLRARSAGVGVALAERRGRSRTLDV